MNSPTPAAADFSPAKTPVAALIPLKAIEVRAQVRKDFDDADLQDLVASIKADGLLQPIIVRPATAVQSGGTGKYELVAGERRLRATKLAGLTEIRAEVRDDLDTAGVQVLQLVENVQRADLSLQEQCDGVAALVKQLEGVDDKTGLQNASEKLGKSLAWVSKRAGVAEAPVEVKNLLKAGKITDVELATGLTELQQVGNKKRFEDAIHRVKNPDTWRGALTRDDIREEIRDAKDEKKRREQAAQNRKAGKKKKLEPWQQQQLKEKEEKDRRRAKWATVGPLCDEFVKAARQATGLDINGPRWDDTYNVPPVPSSVETAQFELSIAGTAESIKQAVSKTGLTLKLQTWDLGTVTPEQAAQLEKLLGRKLRWSASGDKHLTGKQIVAIAAKGGKKLELPKAAEPAKPAVAAATAKPKPKKKS